MSEVFGYFHASIIFSLFIFNCLLLFVIHLRFGFSKIHSYWIVINVVISISAIIHSAILYPLQWSILVFHMQLGSLATIFSGLAAFIVIGQLSNQPVVITSFQRDFPKDLLIKDIPVQTSVKLELYITNYSKVTAKDVVVHGSFPEGIKVQNVQTPTWSFITDDKNGFEIHLDTDKSYNPIHPNMTFTIPINVYAEDKVRYTPCPISTMVNNAPRQNQIFIIGAGMEESLKLSKSMFNVKKYSKLNTITKHYSTIKVVTIILLAASIVPWLIVLINM
ncbi:hypothetical protein [Pontibacillus salipaludis]|uniref:hypothetical protein n=1 Tax=Pontibacillus salipaludis TaxID=1697394 RepID=UPI0031E823A2